MKKGNFTRVDVKLGTVTDTSNAGDQKSFVVLFDDGICERFWEEFKSFNKSVKLNDRVKCHYKHSLLGGYVCHKVTKVRSLAGTIIKKVSDHGLEYGLIDTPKGVVFFTPSTVIACGTFGSLKCNQKVKVVAVETGRGLLATDIFE